MAEDRKLQAIVEFLKLCQELYESTSTITRELYVSMLCYAGNPQGYTPASTIAMSKQSHFYIPVTIHGLMQEIKKKFNL